MTIGAELELQLLHRATYELSSSSPLVLQHFRDSAHVKKEIFQSMLEVTSGIRKNARHVGDDLRETIRSLLRVCESLQLRIAASGTHPFSNHSSSLVYPDTRYQQIFLKQPWLARKLLIFGLHVHVGMRSGDHAILVSNALLYYLPLLLALSSSSPFRHAEDTHLASSRSALYETLPNSGQAFEFESWGDFQSMYKPLLRSGAIESVRDLWWDVRPSPGYGTLEVRICDAPSTIVETEAVIALVHLLCQKIDRELSSGKLLVRTPAWLVRENRWRAIQKGIKAELLVAESGETKTVSGFLESLLEELSPLIERNGYRLQADVLRKIAALGSSADRQRSLLKESKNKFEKVTMRLVDELETDRPVWLPKSKDQMEPKRGGPQCA